MSSDLESSSDSEDSDEAEEESSSEMASSSEEDVPVPSKPHPKATAASPKANHFKQQPKKKGNLEVKPNPSSLLDLDNCKTST